MAEIIEGRAAPEQTGALLAALNARAPTAASLVGFARAFRAAGAAVSLEAPDRARAGSDVIDVCGTGGDGMATFNVSTCVAFACAAAGQPVAKHGNRAVSSRCGSFDALEALGVPFCVTAAEAKISMRRHQLAFLYAPAFHPAFRRLAPTRRLLGARTLLNAVGPLLNPAGVRRQIIGVYARNLVVPMAEALVELGAEDALVVHGDDGSDELSIESSTFVARARSGGVETRAVAPEDAGLRRASAAELAGGDASVNARLARGVIDASDRGPRRDVVILNAAAALMIGGAAGSLREGAAIAARALDGGRARALLEDMRESLATGAAI